MGSREEKKGVSHQAEVDRLLSEASEAKHPYEHKLGRANDCKRGDSIVRGYYLLDEKHFVIEQELSVCLSQTARSWSGKSSLDIIDEIADHSSPGLD